VGTGNIFVTDNGKEQEFLIHQKFSAPLLCCVDKQNTKKIYVIKN
jgi:hypothetical protein